MAEGVRFRERTALPAMRGRLVGMAALLLLCAAMLTVQRGWLAAPPARAPVVIEVRGDVPAPGYYPLQDATVHQALRAAGRDPSGLIDAQLLPGTRIVAEAGGYQLEPMDERLVFGLPIDVNTASALALQAIPGIGATLAANIVADREEQGAFSAVEDLDRVKGIGPATVEKLRPFVVAGSAAIAPRSDR